ncbi:MAG: AAA domain-containing protein [Gammaproteobacteria bacterium]|nr:AAA domain-containing protein [Gammaproteobacteria bacterium]MDD9850528.1 AAA domain-containing protein [Gammaproteobacteria bacterium]
MKGYELQNEFLSFPGRVKALRARRDDGSHPLVLCFPRAGNVDTRVYRRATSYAEQLRGNISLLPMLDAGGFPQDSEYAFGISYEWDNRFFGALAEVEKREMWMMRGVVKILDSLFRCNVSGQFLGENSVFVDKKNHSVRLGFVGLAEVFRLHGSGPWSKNEAICPDWHEDIYHLAKCFEDQVHKSSSEIIRRCLAEKNFERPGYPELLRVMADDAACHPKYPDEVALLFDRKIASDEANQLVDHLNQSDCYVRWKEPGDKRDKPRVTGEFQTGIFAGRFVNSEGDEHYYVPHFSRKNLSLPRGEILQARFRRAQHREQGVEGEYHNLASLGVEQNKKIQEWRIVPKNEWEFIEETAFKAAYRHVRQVSESIVKKYTFLLRGDSDVDWKAVENLKTKQKQLEAVPMSVGSGIRRVDVGEVDDITQGRLVVNLECDQSAGIRPPDKGVLLINNVRVSYDFYWDSGHELWFASSRDSAEEVRDALEKMAKGAGDTAVMMKEKPRVLGIFLAVQVLPEITTRDSQAPKGNIPMSGVLQEDVRMETVPFKRQVNAVDNFEQGNIVEPSLCGILATPSAHNPLVISHPQLDFFDKRLNESQKKAVVGAVFQKPLFLIQGPPGTGKTTVIVEIIRQILAANPKARVLVCSQTNMAVDNVIERLGDKKEKGRRVIRKIRLASETAIHKITRDARPFLFEQRLKNWIANTKKHSNQATKKPVSGDGQLARALAKAVEKSGADLKQERAIWKIVKKWHAFLHIHDDVERCRIRGNVEGGWLSLKAAYLKSMNVVGATCVHIAASRYRGIFGEAYDCLIVDEASKATPAETLIPATLARQVVLIGDHKQLPPFVTPERRVLDKVRRESADWEDHGIEDIRRRFGVSLFEDLIDAFSAEPRLQPCQIMLGEQRRMPKQIGDLISDYFYDGKLTTPEDDKYVQDKRLALPFKRETSLVFINTAERKHPNDNQRSSWRQNACNADVVVETLRCLDQNLKEKSDIAVIAGYRGQVDLLKKKIQHDVKGEKYSHLDLADLNAVVNTVDGFQGRENAIVIYDIVRSSRGADSVGFLDEPRRLNVALSRAQKLLIIVGDADFLIGRAKPNLKLNPDAVNPILGKIAEKIRQQDFVFNSLEEALK